MKLYAYIPIFIFTYMKFAESYDYAIYDFYPLLDWSHNPDFDTMIHSIYTLFVDLLCNKLWTWDTNTTSCELCLVRILCVLFWKRPFFNVSWLSGIYFMHRLKLLNLGRSPLMTLLVVLRSSTGGSFCTASPSTKMVQLPLGDWSLNDLL